MDGFAPRPEEPPERLPGEASRPCLHPFLASADDAGDPGPEGPRHPLLTCLRKWLPPAPAAVLLVGSQTWLYEARLGAAGYEVTAAHRMPEAEAEERPMPPGSYHAVVLLEAVPSALSLGPRLEAIRNLLARDGWLILTEVLDLPSPEPPSGSPLSTARLQAALAEAGFCPRRQQDLSTEARSGARKALAAAGDHGRWRRRIEGLEAGRAVYRALGARRDAFRIRPYEEGDEEQIIDLFREAFHHHRGKEHWDWQYRANPWGSLKLSLAFDERARLVAQYAAYPVRFLRFRQGTLETLHCHQVGDTMTRPSVRNVGRGPTSLLGRTARHFFARFCEGQVHFNYGFNVGNIQRFSMLILKAQRVAPVTYWRRSPAPAGLRPLSAWRRWRGARIEEMSSVDERWDRFLRRVARDYGFLVARDQAYLRWRYLERPGYRYHLLAAFEGDRLAAWSVFRREGDRLMWGDGLVSAAQPHWAEHLLAEALASPFADGISRIDGWFAPQPGWFRRELLRLGFEAAAEPQDLALMLSPFEPEPSAETLDSELFYTLGDSDLF